MILAIGGMHRSGTSLLAKILHDAGMYLGDEEQLMEPAEDNPEGFWEHVEFVGLNDKLLSRYRGGWDLIPELPEGWYNNQTLQSLKEEARQLITSFEPYSFWGWKDPRNTVTLDFWKSLIPGLKFVLAVRHPLEVARSLQKRNFFSLMNGLHLWEQYNKRWQDRLNNPDVLVVHYHALLNHPDRELQRLFQWLKLDVSPEHLEEIKKNIKTDLKHQNDHNVPEEIQERFDELLPLYHTLCQKAGFDPDEEENSETASGDNTELNANEVQETQKNGENVEQPAEEKKDKYPLVSVIIPVFNKLELTHRCLKSLLLNTRYPNYEVIFVDNGSTDGTRPYLQKIDKPNIRAVFNAENLGYVGGCNSGAEVAKGDYLLFLNNDTEVRPYWLSNLVGLAEAKEDAGIVGAKLVYPDGRLQEAGGIIFSDGNGWNYGRGMDPNDPRFNFVREVDYVSGAALLVKRALWDKVGGFDQRYAPAYYEDTDLCFSAREYGYKVYYQPASVVIHYEGQTAGTDVNSGFKKYQQINHQKFVEKWRQALQNQYENKAENVPFASQRGVKLRILVADPFLPMWDRASGSLRLFNYLKILRQLGHHITFFARLGSEDPKYRWKLQQMGIEVYENDEQALRNEGLFFNKAMRPFPYKLIFAERKFDYAIISFWFLAEYYMDVIRRFSPQTRIIVDSVDIHFVRELREAQLKKDKNLEQRALKRKTREIKVYRQADRVWVVTEADREKIKPYVDDVPVDIVPNIHQPVPYQKSFEQSKDLLFVGNFSHPPNVDAVQYFVKEIFPEVLSALPDVKFYVVGNHPSKEIVNLQNENIVVTGFVPELEPYLLKARISVSPLRYGAGMKGKVGEALSYGLPVVTTSIGAEGMNLQHETHVLIADDAQDFARQIIRLYTDQKLWEKLSLQGKEHVEQMLGPAAVRDTLASIFRNQSSQIHKQTPLVSIIMLTFNALEYTKKCINSVLEHTHLPYELILVDNGSQDGTVEYLNALKEQYEHIKVIFNKKNKGFAYGNNQGARRAKGKYLLFLNNDVLVADGWLNDLASVLIDNPYVGMVGPITNSISGRQRVENVPYQDEHGFYAFAAKVRELNKNKITPRRRIAGFCMLMRRDLFEKLGGFDTRFGTGNFEDDDLCVRVRQKGWAIMVHEGVFIHHYGSQTFKANKIKYEANMREKAKLFFKKHPNVDYEELLELKEPLSEVHKRRKELIEKAFAGQNYRQVEKEAKKILSENPLDDEALLYLAYAYFLQEEYKKAVFALKQTLNHDGKNLAALNLLGQTLFAMNKLGEAKNTFEMALHYQPDFLEAKRNLATVLIELGEYAEGVKLVQEILKTNPEDVPTLLFLANLYLDAERLEDAEKIARDVLRLDASNELALKIIELVGQGKAQLKAQEAPLQM